MGKAMVLHLLWVFFVIQLASAAFVPDCLDGDRCTEVKLIAQEERDIRDALRAHGSAQLVDLHGNLIERFPMDGLQQMNQLKTLNLSYNLLGDIRLPNAWNQQLQEIDLTYNNLVTVTIPASVTTFKAVRNKLHTAEFDRNNRLKTLILSMNKFDSFRAFGSLRQIVDLDLSCNQIKEVDLSILSGMSQLRSLNLANNHIHSVTGSGSANSLQTLDLSNNILTMVDEAFNSLSAVRNLNLQNNKIVMWLKDVNLPQLQNMDVSQNDWDCGNLVETFKKFRQNTQTGRDYQCESPKKLENYICCTTSASPYADRLIKYRQEEWHALQVGTEQLKGAVNCNHYQPSPCDGDDTLVQRVASSSLLNAESIAQASVQQLKGSLAKEKQALSTLQRQHAEFKAETERISNIQGDLAAYIDEEYRKAGLTAPGDEVAKLDALFARYDADISGLKEQIKQQDRLNQDKLEEINAVNTEMDDLNSRKNSLLEEINKRNGTVNGYKAKIAELERKIQARDQRT